MIHVGDIRKLSGGTLAPVDLVTGGSPCQDISVAGKREGLAGERSGLFMEQIRITKELRYADIQRGHTGQLVRPRFMLWENVPGVFSSNGGKDLQKVLTETIRIAEQDAPDVPCPAKWPLADAYIGSGWSIAYRVFDAQFWGTPQRRRRVCLVADFGGHAAPEVCFVRKSLSGNTSEDEAQEEADTGTTGESAGTSDSAFGACAERDPVVYDARGNGDGRTVCTLTGDHGNRVTDYTPLCIGNGQANQSISGTVGALNCMHDAPAVLWEDVVRRLTPLEWERLMGFPDNWTNIGDWTDSRGRRRETSDTARYKALGNTICLPSWRWVLKRISAQCKRGATLGSLFDGIGGFPLIWEQLNGRGTALWASEIEEFPIAVTKRHFGGG